MTKVSKRRRRENKTNYLHRVKLLKSETPRVVFRKTNKYVVAQYVVSTEAQDSIKIGISSKALLMNGWPEEMKGSLKSIPAAYLTGYLMGKNILKEKLQQPIVDFGMLRVDHKTKLYGFLKGMIDSGVAIPCKKEAFPEEERIQGKNLKKDFSKEFEVIKTKISKE
ncbi:50S ribosomal protein L18 [archaeon]|jgi:large subunit ribosomal protein L18|nr:50S ribosomal protein L18 [archaeon]